MEAIIAIDPGKDLVGFAYFRGGFLHSCGASRARAGYLGDVALDHARTIQEAIGGRADLVAIERMVYQPNRTKGAKGANDLLDLQAIGGAVLGHLNPRFGAVYLTPKEWKGDRPKEVQHARDARDFSVIERDRIASALIKLPAGLQHNVLDAVGIGLFTVRQRGLRNGK